MSCSIRFWPSELGNAVERPMSLGLAPLLHALFRALLHFSASSPPDTGHSSTGSPWIVPSPLRRTSHTFAPDDASVHEVAVEEIRVLFLKRRDRRRRDEGRSTEQAMRRRPGEVDCLIGPEHLVDVENLEA